MKPNYLFKQEDLLAKTEQAESEDELFLDACQFVVEQGERPHLLYSENSASVIIARHVSLKRWNRKELFLKVEEQKPRDVLISEDEFAAMQETNV